MIFHTPILALLMIAALASGVAVFAALFGLRVLRHWDLASGSRAQLRLERTTQLVSTLFGAMLLAEIFAMILFVFNADRMAPLFVGAMCALGVLNVNAYGFPALYLHIAVFFGAALWLMLDAADRSAPDYPLTRVKYAALLLLAPLIIAAAGVELSYFLNLRTDVITSCCSKLFTPTNPDLEADLSGLAPGPALAVLAVGGLVVALTGALSWRRAWGAGLHALASGAFFLIGLLAVISVLSIYVYEHPNHHCPFCLMKPEYSYIGYAVYLPLFAGTACGLGAGMLSIWRNHPSLGMPMRALVSRLVGASMVAFAVFGLVALWIIWRSNLILFG